MLTVRGLKLLIDKRGNLNKQDLSFNEIDEGFSPKEAIAEAKRCLNCKNPLCKTGCPIENDIPGFLHSLSKGNVGDAISIISQKSNLPAVCGRVCPHEKQCEAACILAKKGQGIKIGKLERFIADFDAEMDLTPFIKHQKHKGNVAIIGSGPAGLTVAGDLAKLGFAATVFEGQAEPGGVLMYGIPDFRLNKEVVRREVRRIEHLGVKFCTNTLVGTDITIDDMFKQGFDAVFVGTGTALPKTLNIPNNTLPGVIQATYFLSTVALANDKGLDSKEIPVHRGDAVVVIGAGNVAMDAARTALRLGAKKVTVVYRRTESEITALKSEYEHAQAEGVDFCWLASPAAFLGNESLEGLQCELQIVGADNKLQSTGESIIIPAQKALLAIGQRPATRILTTTSDIEANSYGYVITRERPYGMTTKVGVFAGGDVVHQPATVVLAMKEAKKVALGIAQYVEAKKLIEDCSLQIK